MEANHLLGNYITKEYELLRSVLSNLSFRDQCSASQVCSSWKSAAEAIWHSRRKPFWLLWYKQCKENMITLPQKALQGAVYCKPQIAFMFVSESLFSRKVQCSGDASCPDKLNPSHRVWEYIEAQLPTGCAFLCLKGFGVIGTLSDFSKTIELESSSSYSALFVPQMPEVKIYPFCFDSTMLKNNPARDEVPDNIQTVIGNFQDEEPISGLVLFCVEKSKGPKYVRPVLKWIQSRQEMKVAVAGGLVSSFYMSLNPEHKRGALVGLAISGKNVIASSTIINSEVNTEEKVDKIMLELKENCQKNCQYSVGLMFACVGRGRYFYDTQNSVESASFRKHFPNTPLLGYFGNGEIGSKCLRGEEKMSDPEGPSRGNKLKRLPETRYLYSYTTIIMHLAFMGSKQ